MQYTGSPVAVHGLSCPAACKILDPQPWIKPVSSALEGRLLTTGSALMSFKYHPFLPFLMKVKEKNEKDGLKLKIEKTKIMASGPITMANRWGNSGNTDKTIFWAPKSLQMVTAALKLRHLLLGRKVMTNLDSILKSITLPTKVHLAKAMVFPVVMYGCES